MAVRKEQVLVLLALAAGTLYWRGLTADPPVRPMVAPNVQGYTPRPQATVPLVTDAVPVPVPRSLLTEPSETQPLPPRELPFPDRAPLSVVALPLEPGPDLGHIENVVLPGTAVEGVTLQGANDEQPAAPEVEPGPVVSETREQKLKRWQRVYDSLWQPNLSSPLLGIVEVDGMDRFDLESRTDFGGVTVRLRQFVLDKEQITGTVTFRNEEIARIRLADNLRNEVRRRVRAVPNTPAHLTDRGNLIAWLLQMARQDATVYEDAKAQAEQYLKDSGGDLEGLQWKLRVLRTMGDVEGEFALLSGIDGRHKGSAFQYEGLGQLKARLGLWLDAEQDLRQAVKIAPLDARPLATLAAFLVGRGRAAEAVPLAQQALAGLGSLTLDSERLRVLATAVGALLAVGDLEGARAALGSLGDVAVAAVTFLKASIDYAAGDCRAALDGFRAAADSIDGPAAQLGAAACLLRLEQWQEALTAFESVAAQAPLLRHRAWTGMALLYLRLGQIDQCLNWVDRALEASPHDTYAFYLRGRAQRLQGQLGPAQESLAAALRQRDDFVHAVAEMSLAHAGAAAGLRGADQAAATLAAVRYADRAVDLPANAPLELRELQGLRRFEAGDLRGAEQAFASARDLASAEEQKLWARGCLAVVDYTLGRYDDTMDKLRALLELPRDHVLRRWAETTQALIDDHAQKEQLEDQFTRREVGNVWPVDRDGELGGAIVDDGLVFAGRWTKGEVSAERTSAVARAGRFLAAAVTMQLGAGHRPNDTFAGLRLDTARATGGQTDCQIQLGVRDGKPFLRIAEGRDEPSMPELHVDGFDPRGLQRLELRVEPRGDGNRQFQLICRWNDQVVHSAQLKILNLNNSNELRTILVASGPRGGACDVRFDDYHLERRKETR